MSYQNKKILSEIKQHTSLSDLSSAIIENYIHRCNLCNIHIKSILININNVIDKICAFCFLSDTRRYDKCDLCNIFYNNINNQFKLFMHDNPCNCSNDCPIPIKSKELLYFICPMCSPTKKIKCLVELD